MRQKIDAVLEGLQSPKVEEVKEIEVVNEAPKDFANMLEDILDTGIALGVIVKKDLDLEVIKTVGGVEIPKSMQKFASYSEDRKVVTFQKGARLQIQRENNGELSILDYQKVVLVTKEPKVRAYSDVFSTDAHSLPKQVTTILNKILGFMKVAKKDFGVVIDLTNTKFALPKQHQDVLEILLKNHVGIQKNDVIIPKYLHLYNI